MDRHCRQNPPGDATRRGAGRGYLHDPDGRVAGFGDEGFQVCVVPRATAVQLIIERHYSHRVVNNSYVHLGVFAGGVLAGALQWGYALNPNSGARVVTGTGNRQYLELNRMWLDDSLGHNAESMAISYAIKYLRRAYPMVLWLQSFADERCGRWGAVYQAANFLYCGCHLSVFIGSTANGTMKSIERP